MRNSRYAVTLKAVKKKDDGVIKLLSRYPCVSGTGARNEG